MPPVDQIARSLPVFAAICAGLGPHALKREILVGNWQYVNPFSLHAPGIAQFRVELRAGGIQDK